MEQPKRICRVCGKEYTGCNAAGMPPGTVFRWKEVACSEECGREYLRRVLVARGEIEEEPQVPDEEFPKRERKYSK